MLTSMTGFITQTISLSIGTETVYVVLQIKSLNGRFFEPTCRLPHSLSHLEPVILKKLREKLVRGTITCSLFPSPSFALGGSVRPSWSTVDAYVEAAQEISARYGSKVVLSTNVDINTLLTLPHALELIESPLEKEISERILQEVDQAIEKLDKDRRAEGKELEADLIKRITNVQSLVTQIKERSRDVVAQRRAKLTQDAATLFTNASAEIQEHQAQFIYAQLEKLDITEELVRLKTHAEAALAFMKTDTPEKGKKLDFIMQEMFREINTIAAKCADSELSAFAISVKVELEKSREQVQNIV